MQIDLSILNKALFIVCGIFFLLIAIMAIFVILQRKRHNNYLREKERLSHDYQQALLQTRIEIQEHAFNQISQEIHDNIGQLLGVVRIQLNSLPLSEEIIQPTDELLERSINELRNLSHNLNTELIQREGFISSVNKLLYNLRKTGRYEVRFEQPEKDISFTDSQSLILFRIIQEAISNIIKHAKASEIAVRINELPDSINISIEDNGRGMDAAGSGEERGSGLKNMENRARMIGASFNILPNDLKGTRVIINLGRENLP